jgi:Fe-S cluster biogenesis protein NfuA
MENLEEVTTKVKAVLNYIRPYLQIDGGDVELIAVTKDGIVEVKLIGACDKCAMRPMTLRAGIERAIMHEVPEIKRIESVN